MNNKIVCGMCGTLNEIGAAFCYGCGMRFEYVCPNCRQPVKIGASICSRCGNTLAWSTSGIGSQLSPKSYSKSDGHNKQSKYVIVSIAIILLLSVIGGGVYIFYRYSQQKTYVIPQATENQSKENAVSIVADTKPPIISDIMVKKLSGNAVDISWITDEESTTQVIWHAKDGSTNSSPQKEALVKQHTVDLTGLNPDKKYYFMVRSVDKFGNESISQEKTFELKEKSEVAKIDVLMHTLTMEENPDGTITFVRGLIINNGDTPVEVNNIRVIVSVSVPGKSDMLDVPASLSPGSNVLSQGDTCKFVALVPNGTKPDYRVRVIINSQE